MPSHGLESLPEYNGHPFDIIDGNMPAFSSTDFATELGYERYSELEYVRFAVSAKKSYRFRWCFLALVPHVRELVKRRF